MPVHKRIAALHNAMTRIADLRHDYAEHDLDADTVAAHPIDQFQQWFSEALETEVPQPNAMTLATTTPDGKPSARVVLLKKVDERGFVFFTNYTSRKGTELMQNPHAALVFWWQPLERQVRVEGRIDRISEDASDAYFQSRPRGSQLGAWASPQSRVIESRAALQERLNEIRRQYDGEAVPRPPHWGGFRLRPDTVEFWQGRPNRLHDRLRYRRTEEGWHLDRLAP